MLLLREQAVKIRPLEENTSRGRKLYIEGNYFSTNVVNGNNRIYPKSMMTEAINNYKSDYMSRNMAGGELKHPNRPNLDPSKIAIKINELNWSGNHVIGKALVVEKMPDGAKISALLDAGFDLGVSSRGLGSLVEENGYDIVQPDYEIRAVDVVTDPSGPGCYVNGLYESTEWFEKDGVWLQVEGVKALNKKSKPQLVHESNLIKKFEKFLGGL